MSILYFRLEEGEMTYIVGQSYYEQNNSVSDIGSHYFMNSSDLEFVNKVSYYLKIMGYCSKSIEYLEE